MVGWLCFMDCKTGGSKPNAVTAIASSGYHQQKSHENPTRMVEIPPLDLKENTLNQTERRLSSLCQQRVSYYGFLPASRSVSLIRLANQSDSSSVELIEENHGRSDLEGSTLYSSSTGDHSQRKDRYVCYPRVTPTPTSTSNFSAFSPMGCVPESALNLSGNLDLSALYSSSTGDYSQGTALFVSYPRVSPKNTSNLSTFSPIRGLSQRRRSLSSRIPLSVMSELIEKP